MDEILEKRCSKCGRKRGEIVQIGDRKVVVKFQKTSYRRDGIKHVCERGDCNICRLAQCRTYEINNRAYLNAKKRKRRLIKKIREGKDA